MGDYFATYRGDSESITGKDRIDYYRVDFERRDSTSNKITEQFTLYPDAFINSKGQGVLTVNPSTKHFWDHDIFTYINGGTLDKTRTDTIPYKSHIFHNPGDTAQLQNGYMVFLGLNRDVNDKRYARQDSDLAIAAHIIVYDSSTKKTTEINPLYILRNKQYVLNIEDTLANMNLYARFEQLIIKSQDSVSTEIMIKQTDPKDDFIVLKALVFPFINVLWLGVIVMVLGFLISLGNLVSRADRVVAAGKK